MMDLEEISKKAQFVDSIIQFLRGTTGTNFQNNVGIILREYYKFMKKEYIMPEPMRGDYKNDGYLKDEGLFYMINSPLSHVDNITDSMKKKFEGDLKGLLKNVYDKNMWGGKVSKTIFIFNNIDKRLPPDPENFFDNTVEKYKKEYDINFENQVMDVYDFRTYLDELPIEILTSLKVQLGISNTVDLNVPNVQDIIDTIGCISEKYDYITLYSNKVEDYQRISTPKKIKINKLHKREEEINAILDKASIVEEVIKLMNQDIEQIAKFETTRLYIINTYKELSAKYSGETLYDLIIEKTLEAHNCRKTLELPLKFLVVYIFDKCDIFEKEEEKNDIT